MYSRMNGKRFDVGSAFAVFCLFILPCYLLLDADIYILPAWGCAVLICYLLITNLLYRTTDYLYASFLAFFYVFLLLAPIIQIEYGSFPWYGFYSSEHITSAWWISFCALAGFEIGYLCNRRKVRDTGKSGEIVLLPQGKLILFIFAVICLIIGVRYAGFENLFLPRVDVLAPVESNDAKDSMMSSIKRVLPVIVLLIFTYDFMMKIKNKASPRVLVSSSKLLIILFVLVMMVNNPISTARFWVGTIFFSLLLLYIVHFTKRKAFFWFSLNFVILVAIFPVMDLFRKSLDVDVVQAFIEVDPAKELRESPDFDAFQQQTSATLLTDSQGFSYGMQTLSSVFFFVPRSIWSEKLQPSGVNIAEFMNYSFVNLSAPLSVEFYLDGWYFGVFAGMLFLGFVYREIYLQFLSGKNVFVSVFYSVFCAYQIYFLRGSLMGVIGFLFVASIFLFLLKQNQRILFKEVKNNL